MCRNPSLGMTRGKKKKRKLVQISVSDIQTRAFPSKDLNAFEQGNISRKRAIESGKNNTWGGSEQPNSENTIIKPEGSSFHFPIASGQKQRISRTASRTHHYLSPLISPPVTHFQPVKMTHGQISFVLHSTDYNTGGHADIPSKNLHG